MLRIFLFCIVLVASPLASAGDVSGFWKHAEEPGWIEISASDGIGTVVRNDKFPDRVGREIIRDLKADASQQNLWRGQVYAERLGEYKDAEISLPGPDRLQFKVKVGFMSRKIDWVRVDEVPAAPAE